MSIGPFLVSGSISPFYLLVSGGHGNTGWATLGLSPVACQPEAAWLFVVRALPNSRRHILPELVKQDCPEPFVVERNHASS